MQALQLTKFGDPRDSVRLVSRGASHKTRGQRLQRSGLLPVKLPRPIDPALAKHAEERASKTQNRIADRITRFSGSMAFV